MFRGHLRRDRGMLFVFPDSRPHQFWMKNCKIALDILWLNAEKEVVYISEATPPCRADPCPHYGPSQEKALYVIEMASGVSKETRVTIGTKIDF